MSEDRLKPLKPQSAREKYYREREEDAAYETLYTVRQGVDLFVEWCELTGIKNLNEVDGRQLLDYKHWCQDNTENKTISLNGILSTLRRFLVFCVQINGVYEVLPNKVPIPKVPDDEQVCLDKPSDEEVNQTIRYLEMYEPASRRHVEYAIMKEVGIRVGGIRAIDVVDIDLENQKIWLRHRPAKDSKIKGTPLKNGTDGERVVNISEELAELIQQYLEGPNRHDVTDKFDRDPLLTTRNGRPSVATIRRDLYKLTRPCEYTGSCPHDRNIEACEYAKDNHASGCPSSHSPHPLRRWSIEYQIDQFVPKDHLSDRVDVSVPVLNKHYDTRSEERRRRKRLEVLERLFEGYGDPDKTLGPEDLATIMNDDGMIDPVELRRMINESNRMEESSTEDDRDSEDSTGGGQREIGQSSFDDFIPAVNQPLLAPLMGGAVAAVWLPDRLSRELIDLTPETEDSPRPSAKRAARGAAAYCLYVCLVSVNLALLGLLPA